MTIREYRQDDCKEITELVYDKVNSTDYTEEQLTA